MDTLIELFENYSYITNALYAGVLSSIACGIVGTLVICNRLTFLAGGASHAAYGGIGIALFFRLPVLACTLIFSTVASLLMALVILKQDKGQAETETDSAIGVLWAAGMAFGIILMQLTPGYNNELTGFLFGSILAVPMSDIYAMAIFDLILFAVVFLFRQGLWAISLDKDFATARGLPTKFLYLLLVSLTAVAVVMLIRIVGLILVLSLLTIPPYIARNCCRGLFATMATASIMAVFFCIAGLAISLHTDIIPGPCIVGIATLAYFLCMLPLRSRR